MHNAQNEHWNRFCIVLIRSNHISSNKQTIGQKSTSVQNWLVYTLWLKWKIRKKKKNRAHRIREKLHFRWFLWCFFIFYSCINMDCLQIVIRIESQRDRPLLFERFFSFFLFIFNSPDLLDMYSLLTVTNVIWKKINRYVRHIYGFIDQMD